MGDPDFDAVVLSEVNAFSQSATSNLFVPRFTDADEIRMSLRPLKASSPTDQMLSRT